MIRRSPLLCAEGKGVLRETKGRPMFNTLKLVSKSLCFFLVLLSLAVCQTHGGDPTTQKPNILFIVTDQQRYDSIGRVQDELSSFYNGKLKIRTPNLDRLSREGVYFRTAYTQCPVCGAARTSLRTGCTIERTGVQTNPLTDAVNKLNPKLFQDKIDQLVGLDQILVEEYGYVSEYYGKWHIPSRLYDRRDGSSRVVKSNTFDYSSGVFYFEDLPWQRMLRKYLAYFKDRRLIKKTYAPGQQQDSYSEYPYTPVSLDSRYGLPTNSPLDKLDFFKSSEASQMGKSLLGTNFSASFLNHDVALRALNRLATQDTPFLLTISYHHPHPPFIATSEYLSYYWDRRQNLFTSPTMSHRFDESNPYFASLPQQQLLDAGFCNLDNVKEWTAVYYAMIELPQQQLLDAGFCNLDNVKEWTAVYYAMIEEIDTLVGIMLDRINTLGIANNALVVFTSDHGEMLGAHCLRDKATFYEESVRVPLFIKLPGVIPADTIVEEPVSHLDVFATILDYAGVRVSNKGDGNSFRPLIEGTSYNSLFDEAAVVSEWDFREPTDNIHLSRTLDDRPNFMVRHRSFKLLIHKKADSQRPDALFNLADDPSEMKNLIDPFGAVPDNATAGKAEHLRYLLLDWMHRVQDKANNDIYSAPIYNAYEGMGDIYEILHRQSWRASDMWVGDPFLVFPKVAWVGSGYIRNEWLYIGRRSPGSLICSFQILGRDAALFHLSTDSATLTAFDVYRLKVTLGYNATVQVPESVDAFIQINNNVGDRTQIPLSIATMSKPPTQPPTRTPSTKPPTRKPSTKPPTIMPSKKPPTRKPSTKPPTSMPSSKPPTRKPSSRSPTKKPTVKPPTRRPTTKTSAAGKQVDPV